MLTREFDKDRLSQFEDWQGNNIALACPVCLKVFIVSGLIHKNGRACPELWKGQGLREPRWKEASVECNEGDMPVWT